VNLLCAHVNKLGLREFAETFFHVAGITDFQERESSNYPEGHYFVGYHDGAEFTVSLSDESGHEDFSVWVQVTADVSEDGAAESLLNRNVREKLIVAGFRMARMENFGKRGEQRIDYT